MNMPDFANDLLTRTARAQAPGGSPLVTIAVWRRVEDDPPANQQLVLTDQGYARWDTRDKRFGTPCGGLHVAPRPTVWCDVVPPAPGGLTLDDLQTAHSTLARAYPGGKAEARLRAALAAEKEGT